MSRKRAIFLGACALCLALVPAALAAAAIQAAPEASTAGGFAIPWWTVDGGGKTSQGGAYTLSGSAGQPDAGSASGGSYGLFSGFWAIKLQESVIYLPVIAK